MATEEVPGGAGVLVGCEVGTVAGLLEGVAGTSDWGQC